MIAKPGLTMRRSLLGSAVLVQLLLSAPALAAPLLFTFSGGVNGSFRLSSNPAVVVENPGNYFFTNFSNETGDFSHPNNTTGRNIAFATEKYRAAFIPPLNMVAFKLSPLGQINVDGPQLFSGTTSSPVFAPGNFALTVASGSIIGTPGAGVNLSISSPGAPLPELSRGVLATVCALLALAATRLRSRHFA